MAQENPKSSTAEFFSFKRSYPESKSWDVELLNTKAIEAFGSRNVATLYERDDGTFCVSRTTHPEMDEYVQRIRFPDKETAASFAYSLYVKAETYRKENQIAADVKDYLERRASALRKEENELIGRFYDIRSERYQLFEFARAHRLERVEWETHDADSRKLVEDLYDFKVLLPKEDGLEQEPTNEEVPFFSEAYLYELLGKDDARTLLRLVSEICKAVAPHVV